MNCVVAQRRRREANLRQRDVDLIYRFGSQSAIHRLTSLVGMAAIGTWFGAVTDADV